MLNDFFQERFNNNLKFYEGKTQEELKKISESIYSGIDLKNIFLAELIIIKKLLLTEQETKIDIDFDEFIKIIDELYTQIENMKESEIQENEETIKMIIVSAKLSLNSPAYFNIDIEKLKEYNLKEQLSQLTQQYNSRMKSTLLKDFKIELETEIKKKEKTLEGKNNDLKIIQDGYSNFEDLYWKINDPSIDIISLIGEFLGNELLSYSERKKCLNEINKLVQEPTVENAEELKNTFAQIATRIRKDINYKGNGILDYEHFTTLIKSVAQCFDEEGRIIRLISNDLIDQCLRQINYSKLDKTLLQRDIVIEQSHQLQRQRVVQIAKIIEERTKKLAKNIKPKRKKAVTDIPNSHEIYGDYKDLLETAQKIVKMELNQVMQNEEMELDEVEALFVEELQSDNLNKETLERIVMIDANSDLCKIKFIVYGLNYQLENIKESNMKKSLELIELYVHYYKIYKRVLIDELEQQENCSAFIEQSIKTLKNIIGSYENIEKMFDNITEEQQNYIDSYKGIDLNYENIDELNRILANVNLDSDFITLYRNYKLFDNTVKDTLELLELMKDEKIKNQDIIFIKERIKVIQELEDQLEKAKKLYDENQRLLQEQKVTLDDIIQNGENVLVFFEIKDGITQAEERIIDDSKIHGRFRNGEVGDIEDLLNILKKRKPEELQPPTSVKILDKEGYSYGHRLSTGGHVRVAYEQISSEVLKTNKAVYLIISVGKKMSSSSKVYEDAIKFRGEIDEFKKRYEQLAGATPEKIQDFLERQKQHEKRIMEVAQKGKGVYDGDTGFSK